MFSDGHSALVKTWIDTQYQREELNYKISPPEIRDATIRIQGGLPALPGTNITMPTRRTRHCLAFPILQRPRSPMDGGNTIREA